MRILFPSTPQNYWQWNRLLRSLVVKFGWKWSPNKKVLGVSMRKFRSEKDQKAWKCTVLTVLTHYTPFQDILPIFPTLHSGKKLHTTLCLPKIPAMEHQAPVNYLVKFQSTASHIEKVLGVSMSPISGNFEVEMETRNYGISEFRPHSIQHHMAPWPCPGHHH